MDRCPVGKYSNFMQTEKNIDKTPVKILWKITGFYYGIALTNQEQED